MSKDITVQITVQEYGPELYKINKTGSFIRKELCTVIKTMEHGYDKMGCPNVSIYEGITMRDYFAAKALSTFNIGQLDGYYESHATSAYQMADEMLIARTKQK